MKEISLLPPGLLLAIGFMAQKMYLVTLLEMFTHDEKVDNTALEWEAIDNKYSLCRAVSVLNFMINRLPLT